MIFAWEDLKELAKVNIEGARNKLMDVLCNYQGFKKCNLILVFDAYKVQGQELGVQKYHNIYVVYTKEAETADKYIEKVVHEIGRKYHVTVGRVKMHESDEWMQTNLISFIPTFVFLF